MSRDIEKMNDGQLMRLLTRLYNERKRDEFKRLGDSSGRYTPNQKEYAFSLINENGIRSAARILEVPRRTLQRWCRKEGKRVCRCPSWVWDYAAKRRYWREYWQRRGK